MIHRFVVQAILGVPLTVYGKGAHQRGFISLNDSVQALELAVNNPAKRGKVQTWNQLSSWHTMNEIAECVVNVAEKFGIDAKISHIDTPRNERTDVHYYYYVTENLKKLGYKQTRDIEEEIEYMIEKLRTPVLRQKDILLNVVKPTVYWNPKLENKNVRSD